MKTEMSFTNKSDKLKGSLIVKRRRRKKRNKIEVWIDFNSTVSVVKIL